MSEAHESCDSRDFPFLVLLFLLKAFRIGISSVRRWLPRKYREQEERILGIIDTIKVYTKEIVSFSLSIIAGVIALMYAIIPLYLLGFLTYLYRVRKWKK